MQLLVQAKFCKKVKWWKPKFPQAFQARGYSSSDGDAKAFLETIALSCHKIASNKEQGEIGEGIKSMNDTNQSPLLPDNFLIKTRA